MHAPSTDYTFAYILNNLPDAQKEALATAFQDALAMSSKIKEAVKQTSGQQVVNGVYVEDQEAMTKAMNSIEGMGMTGANQKQQSGNGTPTEMINAFFQSILGGLGGDVTPMNQYLTSQMASQQTTSKGISSNNFGTVMGLVSLMPVLDIPVTTFIYAYIAGESKTWFEHVHCHDEKRQSYNYTYTAVRYNYVKAC